MIDVRRTSRKPGSRGFCGPAWALLLGLLPGFLGCATDDPPSRKRELTDDAAVALVAGEVLLKKGDLDGSLAEFNRAISLDPRHAAGYAGRAYVRHRRGDSEGAIADFTRAVQLDPRMSTAYAARGFV